MNMFAWAVILSLVVVNALYVAAEFACVSVRHSQIQGLAQNGNRIAGRLFPILADSHKLDRYIAACQIGITLSSLIAGAYGQATIGRDIAALLRSTLGWTEAAATGTSVLATLILLTTFQVVFGELVPKSLALQFSTSFALGTYWPMMVSVTLFTPLIAVLNGSGLFLLRLLGMGGQGGHRHIHSPEEIEMLIAESRDGGYLEPEEQERLHHALQLGRRTARQLMVPRRMVQMIDIATPIDEVVQLVIESPFTRLPVYEATPDNVIGLLHTKDLASRCAENPDAPCGGLHTLHELLRPVTTVPESVAADSLLKLLRERRARLAIVVDEFGGVDGVVTLEDVLDELIGQVGDEFKGGQISPETLPDGRVRVPGLLRLDEMAEHLNIELHSEDAETVGGLMLETLGRLPAQGERVQLDGTEIEVESMDGQAIVSLLIKPDLKEREVQTSGAQVTT